MTFGSGALTGAAWDHSENGGTTLQWKIPASALAYRDYNGTNLDMTYGGMFTIYGTTQNISEPDTYDTTAALVVPEPMSLAMIGLGMAGFVARRRRA